MDERSCGCALKCCEKLPANKRKAILLGFWALGKYDIQNAYISGCIQIKTCSAPLHCRCPTSRHGKTPLYYDRDGEYLVHVCKSAFLLLIHSVSNGCVSRALQGVARTGGLPKLDQRGHHEPPNKTSDQDMVFNQ